MATITIFGEKILGTPYPVTIYSAELDTGGSALSNFNLLLTAGVEMTFTVNAEIGLAIQEMREDRNLKFVQLVTILGNIQMSRVSSSMNLTGNIQASLLFTFLEFINFM